MKFLKAVFFLVCVFVVMDANAQSSADLKRQRDKLNDELTQLNHEYQETLTNKKVTLKQLNLIKAQISLREEKIKNINSEVRNLDNQISENNNTVHTLQGRLDDLKKEYAAMVLFAYRNQSAYNKLMFIFASKDFNQAYKRLKYLQDLGSYRQRQAYQIQGTQKELHVKIIELDKTKEEKHSLLADQVKEEQTLDKEKSSQLKVVVDLSKHAGQIRQEESDKQRQLAKIKREINAAIQREIEEERRKEEEAEKLAAKTEAAKARAENKDVPVSRPVAKNRTNSQVLNATPEAAKLSNDFLGNRGRLPWPVVNGEVTHGFGTYYIEGIKSESSGLDIKTNSGASVRAVFDGEVIRVVDVLGTAMVMVRHGEYFTVYSNLKSASVSKGQKVSTKQILGTVATDSSTGETEVHFELYKGTTAVNPQIWLADR
jgi:septal ring factor EnvC (AmiA/AmiB activator)